MHIHHYLGRNQGKVRDHSVVERLVGPSWYEHRQRSCLERALQRIASTLIGAMVTFSLVSGCGETVAPTPSASSDVFLGAQPSDSPNATAIGALFGASGFQNCSAAFISDTFAITAARCLAQPGPYYLVLESPTTSSSVRLPIANAIPHPWWNNAELNRAGEHVAAVRQGMFGPFREAASYDIAMLQLATPKSDGVYFERLRFRQNSIETLYFVSTPNGNNRAGGQLNVTEATPTTITVTDYSQISTTGGGGAAMITLDNGRVALMGVASAGDGQGILFTQINPHSNFIFDVLMGVYSPTNDLARYSVEVSGTGPTPGPDNPGPGPGNTFNCAQMSDGFCDPNCSAGPDPDCTMDTPVRTGAPFGAPCQTGEDCITRVCLSIGDERKLCSDTCDPGVLRACPPDFNCTADIAGEYICAPNVPPPPMTGGAEPVELRLFGADCANDAQCTSNTCINHGGSRWCSIRCMQTDDCPLSYVCASAGSGKACVPPGM